MDFAGTGLTWCELTGIADAPSSRAEAPGPAEGVQDTASLLLPLLTDPDVPEEAPARVATALTEIGAPVRTASATANHLLAHLARRSRHDPAWASPLSGS
ncbi:hypothetical protein ACOZE3_11875 [Streptomyces cinereoruber]|uniref:hypothetical protein n=1 Tax=Streptomyces cinereoruber TaxID=67260 RepID=UPI003BF53FF2